MSELLSARKMRLGREVKVELPDGAGHVLARREDLTTAVFDGRVPMPLLTAVQKMIDMPNASTIDRLEVLGDGGGKSLMQVLREHVVRVCINPVVVMEDDGDPDHLPVEYLDVPQLMAIWTATALVPQVTVEEAAEFRAGGSLDAPDVPRPGESVQSPPFTVVARRDVEIVTH